MDENRDVVAVVGAGYVGATTAVGLTRSGHRVLVVDNDACKVEDFRAGRCPVEEPGLSAAVAEAVADDRLAFTTELRQVRCAAMTFVCVPTPPRDDGSADVTVVESVLSQLATTLCPGSTIVVKSTVPVGTTDRLTDTVGRGIAVVTNPEFLRQSHALHDVEQPSRIVIGARDSAAARSVAELYRDADCPVVCTDPPTAELAKYASNCFLALKLSFINEIADFAGIFGADIDGVTEVMGLDPRIGGQHLRLGPGWGGACLPKDAAALRAGASAVGAQLSVLDAAIEENEHRCERIADRLLALGRDHGQSAPTVALLGLTFKSGTPDVTASPALRLAGELTRRGVRTLAHDPVVSPQQVTLPGLEVVDDAAKALRSADVAAVRTDWPQYRRLPWSAYAPLAIYDTRRCLDVADLAEADIPLIR